MEIRPEESLRQILETVRLSTDDVRKRLAWSTDRNYWLAINPNLTIGEEALPNIQNEIDLTPEEIGTASTQFQKEGYFQIRPVILREFTIRLSESIDAIRRKGWPAVFSMVYDQFWHVARSSPLMKIIEAVLGLNWKQTCHFWVYFVDPKGQGSGWPPHVDGTRQGLRVSLWIPITDATLDNGCMYLIPANRCSESAIQSFCGNGNISPEIMSELLQNCRAVPADAGSLLCWQYGLIHWGSACNPSTQNPRISLGLSFISEKTMPTEREHPLLGSGSLPLFDQRLHLIANNILTYMKREPLMIRYEEFSRKLINSI